MFPCARAIVAGPTDIVVNHSIVFRAWLFPVLGFGLSFCFDSVSSRWLPVHGFARQGRRAGTSQTMYRTSRPWGDRWGERSTDSYLLNFRIALCARVIQGAAAASRDAWCCLAFFAGFRLHGRVAMLPSSYSGRFACFLLHSQVASLPPSLAAGVFRRTAVFMIPDPIHPLQGLYTGCYGCQLHICRDRHMWDNVLLSVVLGIASPGGRGAQPLAAHDICRLCLKAAGVMNWTGIVWKRCGVDSWGGSWYYAFESLRVL